MKPTPPNWPRISSAIYYQDAARALDWLCDAFGFVVRLRVDGDDGGIAHSELEFGEGLIMVASEGGWSSSPERKFAKSPRSVDGANTQSLMAYVDDVEAHFARAKAAGATIITTPTLSDHGPEYWADIGYSCEDIEGHTWYFAERVRNP